MHLKPGSFALTLLLAFMTAMGPISTDLYVPSLPQLAVDLQTTPGRVQWTMSGYLIGFAFGQIFYGPFSDKFGRRPVLMAAFALYLLGCIIAFLSPTVETLTAARVLQGIGGAGPVIIARAIVRDMYEGARASHQLSIMSTVMGLAPIVSPIIGGVLAMVFGWRASFVTMLLVVGAIAGMSSLFLPETIRERMPGRLNVQSVVGGFGIIARNRVWRVYASLQGFGQTGLFTFVSASPFVLKGVYGITPLEFGIGFSICSMAFVSGAWTSSRLVSKHGIEATIGVGVVLLGLAGVLQMAGVLLFPSTVVSLFLPELLFFAGVGFVIPNSVAGYLAPFPERAGAASSLAGFLQMSFSAAVGLIVVSQITDNAIPLALTTFIMGVGACIVYFFFSGMDRVRARS